MVFNSTICSTIVNQRKVILTLDKRKRTLIVTDCAEGNLCIANIDVETIGQVIILVSRIQDGIIGPDLATSLVLCFWLE
jgi:hypothetical protein